MSAAPALALVAIMLAAIAIESARLMRASRRTQRVNRAMHELRRPMQALSLALGGEWHDRRGAEACLEQARIALADLDAAVNGRHPSRARTRVALSDLAVALEDRWRRAGVAVDATADGELLDADPGRLGSALDNLVANALRHGSRPIAVRASTAPGKVRFEVRDAGPLRAGPGPVADPRHGHGLRLAASVAESHGGDLTPPRRDPSGETVAAISIPISSSDRGDRD